MSRPSRRTLTRSSRPSAPPNPLFTFSGPVPAPPGDHLIYVLFDYRSLRWGFWEAPICLIRLALMCRMTWSTASLTSRTRP